MGGANTDVRIHIIVVLSVVHVVEVTAKRRLF